MTDTVNTQPAGRPSRTPTKRPSAPPPMPPAKPPPRRNASGSRRSAPWSASRSLDEAVASEMIDAGTAVGDASKRVFAELAKREESNNTRGVSNIQTLTDETDMRRQAISDALLHRAAPLATS